MDKVRDKASIRFSEPVDGQVRRKSPSRQSSTNTRRAIDTHSIVVDPAVLAVAQEKCRPGERFVIVDERTMRSVYI